MRMSKLEWAVMTATLLGIGSFMGLHAQENRTAPTAQIEEPSRTFEEIGHLRGGARPDSTIPGGTSGAPRPESRITLPGLCETDPGAYGCPQFCTINPGHYECQPDDDEGGSIPAPTPTPSDPPPVQHCGVPYDQWPEPVPGSTMYGVFEKCQPYMTGWDCGDLHYIQCQ